MSGLFADNAPAPKPAVSGQDAIAAYVDAYREAVGHDPDKITGREARAFKALADQSASVDDLRARMRIAAGLSDSRIWPFLTGPHEYNVGKLTKHWAELGTALHSAASAADQSDEQRLMTAVAVLYPSFRLTPAQAQGLLRRMGRISDMATILEGITDAWTEHPDRTKPVWADVEQAIYQRRSAKLIAGRPLRRKDDLDEMRDRYRPHVRVLLWAGELLDAECADPDSVTESDLRNWDEVWRLWSDYNYYELGRPFSRPTPRWWKPNPWPTAPEARLRRRMKCEALITRINNLRTFGQRTEYAKNEWAEAMNAEAEVGGLNLYPVPVAEEW